MLTDGMLRRAFRKVSRKSLKPTILRYKYPGTGYQDVEVAYDIRRPSEIPFLADALFPKFLLQTRVWINARIKFKVDEGVAARHTKQGTKYLIPGVELMAVAETKPTLDPIDAIADYGTVVEDVGQGRIKFVEFLMYTGPSFPGHLYDHEPTLGEGARRK